MRSASPEARLSHILREGTAAAHRAAEAHPFVAACRAGTLTPRVWARYLAELHPIYAALESGLETAGGAPPFRALAAPELRRADWITRDLETLGRAPAPPHQAASHIDNLARKAPEGLIGHAYARYFGDLLGGRVMARAVERTLGPGAPTRCLRFVGIERPAAYLDRVRATMDRHPWTPGEVARILDEARRAFADATAVMTVALAEAPPGQLARSAPD